METETEDQETVEMAELETAEKAMAESQATSDRFPAVVSDRTVFTYWYNNRPRGVVTGYWGTNDADERGFFIEHVIVFPGEVIGTLPAMLAAAEEAAYAEGATYLATYLMTGYNLKLENLIRRFKFEQYASDDEGFYYFKRRF